MNGAMAEAMSHAAGEENVEKKIEAALSCPCLGQSLETRGGAAGPFSPGSAGSALIDAPINANLTPRFLLPLQAT
jgi:hypothetical protein